MIVFDSCLTTDNGGLWSWCTVVSTSELFAHVDDGNGVTDTAVSPNGSLKVEWKESESAGPSGESGRGDEVGAVRYRTLVDGSLRDRTIGLASV